MHRCEISKLENNFLTDVLGYKESGRDLFKVDNRDLFKVDKSVS